MPCCPNIYLPSASKPPPPHSSRPSPSLRLAAVRPGLARSGELEKSEEDFSCMLRYAALTEKPMRRRSLELRMRTALSRLSKSAERGARG